MYTIFVLCLREMQSTNQLNKQIYFVDLLVLEEWSLSHLERLIFILLSYIEIWPWKILVVPPWAIHDSRTWCFLWDLKPVFYHSVNWRCTDTKLNRNFTWEGRKFESNLQRRHCYKHLFFELVFQFPSDGKCFPCLLNISLHGTGSADFTSKLSAYFCPEPILFFVTSFDDGDILVR